MSINTEINRLLNFAKQNMLINEDDYYYAANRLLDVLKVDAFEPEFVDEKLPTAMPILENMLDYAAEKGLIENTTENRDLFDTRIMDCVMPRPSEVVRRFTNDYARSPKAATDEFYKMSIASNYIRKDRIDKNIVWKTATEYGDLDITINLSKPEKDPRDIAKAKLAPSSGYPKCLLCRENEGYAGHPGHPARETHRLIPLRLSAHRWFLQYSPYTYYNEHCIVLNRKHVPMKVSRKSFENLLDFVTIFPHYFLGSNADLPIVGGSILSHDHYQGGRYTFAMAKAPIEKFYTFPGFEDIKVGRVKWPMSTIRLQGEDREELADLAEKILDAWRKYSDPSVEILAETDGTPAQHDHADRAPPRQSLRARPRAAQQPHDERASARSLPSACRSASHQEREHRSHRGHGSRCAAGPPQEGDGSRRRGARQGHAGYLGHDGDCQPC